MQRKLSSSPAGSAARLRVVFGQDPGAVASPQATTGTQEIDAGEGAKQFVERPDQVPFREPTPVEITQARALSPALAGSAILDRSETGKPSRGETSSGQHKREWLSFLTTMAVGIGFGVMLAWLWGVSSPSSFGSQAGYRGAGPTNLAGSDLASSPEASVIWFPLPARELRSSEGIRAPAADQQAGLSAGAIAALPSPPLPDRAPQVAHEVERGRSLLEVTNVDQISTDAGADRRTKLVLHLSVDVAQSTLDDLQTIAQEAGFEVVVDRAATISVRQSQVFFFHREDAPDATRIADAIGARVRDFSAYRPAPDQGWLEVWLAD